MTFFTNGYTWIRFGALPCRWWAPSMRPRPAQKRGQTRYLIFKSAAGNQRELQFNRDLTGRIERISQVDWRYQAPAYVTTATDLATVSHLPFGPRTTVTEAQTPGFQARRQFDTDFQQDQLTVTRGAATGLPRFQWKGLIMPVPV